MKEFEFCNGDIGYKGYWIKRNSPNSDDYYVEKSGQIMGFFGHKNSPEKSFNAAKQFIIRNIKLKNAQIN